MLYDVYQLYQAGKKVDFAAVVAREPVRGQLELMRRFPNFPSMLAVLVDDQYKDMIVPLVDAKVVRMKADALLISGLEIHFRVVKVKSHTPCYYIAQKWLCKVVKTDQSIG